MSELTLDVERRQGSGKNQSRRLRASGKVPGVVYGSGGTSVSIQVDRIEMTTILRQSGDNPIFLLKVPGTSESRHTMIKEMQVDPIEHRILHVDFQRIEMSESVQVKVGVELVGEPEGVTNEGGLVEFVTREVEIECLPAQIPTALPLDMSALHIGMHLEAGDIELPEGVLLLEDEARVIVSVAAPRIEEEEEVEEEEELLEGETEEPEVISGAKEGDEEEAADGEG